MVPVMRARGTASTRGEGHAGGVCLWSPGELRAVRRWRCTASLRPGYVFQDKTLLMWACSELDEFAASPHEESLVLEATASMLIDKGADVNAKANSNVSPARGSGVRMTGSCHCRGRRHQRQGGMRVTVSARLSQGAWSRGDAMIVPVRRWRHDGGKPEGEWAAARETKRHCVVS
eukprot:2925635-Rhodomonas_salina.6